MKKKVNLKLILFVGLSCLAIVPLNGTTIQVVRDDDDYEDFDRHKQNVAKAGKQGYKMVAASYQENNFATM